VGHPLLRRRARWFCVGGIDTDGDSDTDPEGAGMAEKAPKTLHQTGANQPIGGRVASSVTPFL
jgi:hypothetical protein